jgi:DNA polymerase-3 subunit delta'
VSAKAKDAPALTDPSDPPWLPPRRNPDLVGHDEAEREIIDSWASGRFTHSWMLTGPKGVGKATLAYRMARFVLSGGGEEDLFGGPPASLGLGEEHPVFRQVSALGHPDFLAVTRRLDKSGKKLAQSISVDVARQIPGFMSLTPSAGDWRVVVIDAVDEMRREASNAILKILEEPPRQSLIILVCHQPSRILPTIRSRCRRLALQPLNHDVVVELLGRHHPEMDSTIRMRVADMADGSIGRAMSLIDAGGLDLMADLDALLDGLPVLDPKLMHGLADNVARAGAERRFEVMIDMVYRRLGQAISRSAAGRTGEIGKDGLLGAVAAAANAGSLEPWIEVWEKVARLGRAVATVNTDRKQAALDALLSIQAVAHRKS